MSEPFNFNEAMRAAGFSEVRADQATELLVAWQTLSGKNNSMWSDGIAWEVRIALDTLAWTRSKLPWKVGDRVMVLRPDLEAPRWHQRGVKEIQATFEQSGTVESIEFSPSWQEWSVMVRFDKEFWYNDREDLLVEKDNTHVWPFSVHSLYPAEDR